jgi:periplasmic protein TonB
MKAIYLFLFVFFNINAQKDSIVIIEEFDDIIMEGYYKETLPIYPGCEKEIDENKMNCLKENIKSFILDNSTKKIKKYLKQSKINLNFIHKKDGTITLNNFNSEFYKEEIENIISKLPRVIPATQRNRPVKFNFKIDFK